LVSFIELLSRYFIVNAIYKAIVNAAVFLISDILVEYLGSVRYRIMSSANRDNLTSSFLV
jgi:hypothetical protein